MARTAIAVQDVPKNGVVKFTTVAADAANGMMFPNDARTSLYVENTDVAAKTVTVVSVADPVYGRTGDVAQVLNQNEKCLFSHFIPSGFSQQSGVDAGYVYVNFSAATNVKVAALRDNLV